MELSEQLDLRKSWLGVQWAPQDQNVHADALTNEDFHNFDMDKRILMEPGAIGWVVLDTMIEVGGGMVEELRRLKEKRKKEKKDAKEAKRRRKTAKAEALRVRDPW